MPTPSLPNPVYQYRTGHKFETCGCPTCKKGRRLLEEAVAGSTQFRVEEAPARPRAGWDSVAAYNAGEQQETIEADVPFMVATQPNSMRNTIARWIQMRVDEPNITNIEVARRIGISVRSLNSYISKATKEGWLKFDDMLSRMEYEVVPLTVDNLVELLKKKDKTAIIETAKGTIFKTYQASQGIVEGQQTILALKIEMPKPGEEAQVVVGQVIGKPRQIDET